MKFTWPRIVAFIVAVVICLVVGYNGARWHWATKADTKVITISALDDYKAYEALDRQQAALVAEWQKLAERKVELRHKLGVPDTFAEQREDAKNPQSPVIGFIAPVDSGQPKQ